MGFILQTKEEEEKKNTLASDILKCRELPGKQDIEELLHQLTPGQDIVNRAVSLCVLRRGGGEIEPSQLF